MNDQPQKTPQQTRDELLAHCRAAIEAARAKLAVNVLLGQGFVCAFPNGSMAITTQGETRRLRVTTGELMGVSHWTERDANIVAKAWNEFVIGKEFGQTMIVEVMHRNELLRRLIVHMKEMIGWMENGFQAA